MFEKTKAYIDKMQQEAVMPGCVYAFVNDDKTSIHSQGTLTYDTDESITVQTVFDLASLTKVIGTTTVILQLLETKQLKLDDRVKTFLPIQNEALTIRHLLTHTSQFQGYIPNRNQLEKDRLKEALLTEMQPGEDIGTVVRYSDINFLYLGWIAEVLCHQPIQQLITESVINSLSLSSMTFHPLKQECAPTEGTLQGTVHDPKTQKLKEHSGSAGLFSNIIDIITFVKSYFNDGYPLLHKETIESLSQSYSETERPYSLGWNLEKVADHYALTHTGYTGTYLFIDLTLRQSFIFLSHRIQPVDDRERYLSYRDTLIQIYIQELEELSWNRCF